jgi:hypothetical protein
LSPRLLGGRAARLGNAEEALAAELLVGAAAHADEAQGDEAVDETDVFDDRDDGEDDEDDGDGAGDEEVFGPNSGDADDAVLVQMPRPLYRGPRSHLAPAPAVRPYSAGAVRCWSPEEEPLGADGDVLMQSDGLLRVRAIQPSQGAHSLGDAALVDRIPFERSFSFVGDLSPHTSSYDLSLEADQLSQLERSLVQRINASVEASVAVDASRLGRCATPGSGAAGRCFAVCQASLLALQ